MKKKLLMLMAMPFFAYGANLPYEGVITCSDDVIGPSESELKTIDAGYMLDKNCKTIFVKPPKSGDAIIQSTSLTGAADLCSSFEYMKDEKRIIEVELSKLNKQLREVDDLDERAYERLKDKLKFTQDYADRILDSLAASENTIGLVAKVSFETNWENLVVQYRKMNPGKLVKRLPVVSSVLTIASQRKADAFSASLTGSGSATNGVYDVKIPGVKLSSMIDLAEYIGVEGADESTYLFGESLTGQLQLNHYGMCSIKDLFKNNSSIETLRDLNRRAVNSNLDAQVTANLNMWYPVNLNKSYSVEFVFDEVYDKVHKFTKEKTTFSTKDIVDVFDDLVTNEHLKIIISDDAVTNEEQAEIETVRQLVIDDIAEKVLNKIADPVIDSGKFIELQLPNDPHIMETKSRRLCRSKKTFFFSYSKRCWTETYKVKKAVKASVTGIDKELRKIEARYTERIDRFSTVLRHTTLGFTKENE